MDAPITLAEASVSFIRDLATAEATGTQPDWAGVPLVRSVEVAS